MAEFICNREFLNEFYTHLQFMYSGITQIDADSLKLTNLKVLNLFNNKIATIDNIPASCTELYLDFNMITSIKVKTPTALELLSISHNQITDRIFRDIMKKMPALRCLNVAYNRIEDIRKFVEVIKSNSAKVKVVISRNNPMAMLALYWEYITEAIALDYFDNEKYVKSAPIVDTPSEPKEIKKEEKKDEKKDNKKDAKKGGKA